MARRFFVYGSLMDGLFNYEKYFKGKVLSKTYARTKGELYHLSKCGYPAMIDGDDFVYGELFEIGDYDETLKRVDAMEHFFGEGNPDNEYNRELIEVELLETGEKEFAFAYIYNAQDVEELRKNNPYIESGRWREFLENDKKDSRALA